MVTGSGKLAFMGAQSRKPRKCWVTVDGGPMDGVTFTVTLVGPMPAKLYGPDVNVRMAGVYLRAAGSASSGLYRLRRDCQQEGLEHAWTGYLMQRLTREEWDGEST